MYTHGRSSSAMCGFRNDLAGTDTASTKTGTIPYEYTFTRIRVLYECIVLIKIPRNGYP